jgi:hypothetical protein
MCSQSRFDLQVAKHRWWHIALHLATRQKLIPSTGLACLSIGNNRSMWMSKGSEILRLDTSRRPAPGTIPEMRLDLFGLRPHRCNQLEIVKGGSPFSDT